MHQLDFNTTAHEYLRLQGALQWLNLLSPHLFGFAKIPIAETPQGIHYGNAALRHWLTPFGNDISAEFLWQMPDVNIAFALHNYTNHRGYFLGVEAEVIDHPVTEQLRCTARVMVWNQPASFYELSGQLGGLLTLQATLQFATLRPYLEFEGKTAGWVAGNVFLGENFSTRAGLQLSFE